MEIIFASSRFASDGKTAGFLIQLVSVLTNSEQIDRIQRFANKNGLDSNELLEAALENARHNLKWDEENVPIIKNVVQQMISIVE